jgi:hypothetical protein
MDHENKEIIVILWQVLPWLVAVTLVSLGIGVGYFLTTKIYGSKSALQLSRQFWGFVFLIVTPYIIILYLLPENYKDSLRATLYVVMSGVLISLLIAQIEGTRRVKFEKILLDLGLDPNGFWLLLLGAIFISGAVALITINVSNSQVSFLIAVQIIFSILVGVLGLYKGSTKTVFTENGIFSVAGYTGWTNIRSYEWQESKLPILKLKLTNSWVTLNRAYINIDLSDKDAVEALLAKKLVKHELSEGYKTA